MPAVKRLGRPRAAELRKVLDAILYIARTGCQWRMLSKDFPPFTTVQGYFYDWRDNGLFETINFHLLLQAREGGGPRSEPVGGGDRQSIGQERRRRCRCFRRVLVGQSWRKNGQTQDIKTRPRVAFPALIFVLTFG